MFSPRRVKQTSAAFATSHLPLRVPAQAASHSDGFTINVVFTNIHATLAALEQASQLAHELQAWIRILVPQVVPYPLALERPPRDPHFKVRQLRTVCSQGTIDTLIEVRLCRDAGECVRQALSPESLVVIGGRKHWWGTRETRLARHLEQLGHKVVFAQQN